METLNRSRVSIGLSHLTAVPSSNGDDSHVHEDFHETER